MTSKLGSAFLSNFLGQSPIWYKQLILVFLIINPIVFVINPFLAGWVLIIEFIMTLAMAPLIRLSYGKIDVYGTALYHRPQRRRHDRNFVCVLED